MLPDDDIDKFVLHSCCSQPQRAPTSRRADQAMYEAKRGGRNRFEITAAT